VKAALGSSEKSLTAGSNAFAFSWPVAAVGSFFRVDQAYRTNCGRAADFVRPDPTRPRPIRPSAPTRDVTQREQFLCFLCIRATLGLFCVFASCPARRRIVPRFCWLGSFGPGRGDGTAKLALFCKFGKTTRLGSFGLDGGEQNQALTCAPCARIARRNEAIRRSRTIETPILVESVASGKAATSHFYMVAMKRKEIFRARERDSKPPARYSPRQSFGRIPSAARRRVK